MSPALATFILPAATAMMLHASSMPTARARAPVMGFFDGLAAAFENDDTLSEQEEAGLKQKARFQTLTWRGPKPEGAFNPFEQQAICDTKAIAGQKLSVIAMQEGIPIKYSCMQGTCRICDVMVDGQMVPSCMAQVVRAPRRTSPSAAPVGARMRR